MKTPKERMNNIGVEGGGSVLWTSLVAKCPMRVCESEHLIRFPEGVRRLALRVEVLNCGRSPWVFGEKSCNLAISRHFILTFGKSFFQNWFLKIFIKFWTLLVTVKQNLNSDFLFSRGGGSPSTGMESRMFTIKSSHHRCPGWSGAITMARWFDIAIVRHIYLLLILNHYDWKIGIMDKS